MVEDQYLVERGLAPDIASHTRRDARDDFLLGIATPATQAVLNSGPSIKLIIFLLNFRRYLRCVVERDTACR